MAFNLYLTPVIRRRLMGDPIDFSDWAGSFYSDPNLLYYLSV